MEEIDLGRRMGVAMETGAIQRGPVTMANHNGHAILGGGVLVTEDGCPLSYETLDAHGCEQWDVEIVLRPVTKRRGLTAMHRGTLGKLLTRGLNEPGFWDEQYNPKTKEWEELP